MCACVCVWIIVYVLYICNYLFVFPVLAEDVTEVKAWQCKAVALINLEQFSDALTTTNKSKFFS